jgi:hypothetical protein
MHKTFGKCWCSNQASLSSLGEFKPYAARHVISLPMIRSLIKMPTAVREAVECAMGSMRGTSEAGTAEYITVMGRYGWLKSIGAENV